MWANAGIRRLEDHLEAAKHCRFQTRVSNAADVLLTEMPRATGVSKFQFER